MGFLFYFFLDVGFSGIPLITKAQLTFNATIYLRYTGDDYASFNGTSIFKIDILNNTTDYLGTVELSEDHYNYHLSATEGYINFTISGLLRLDENVCDLDEDVSMICFNVTPGANATYEPSYDDQTQLKCSASSAADIRDCGKSVTWY